MNFSGWAIRNPVPVVLLFILLTTCGLMGFHFLSIQNFPDLDLPVIYISATLDGAAPSQLETEVARKIEDQLSTISKLDHINTTITDGSVSITVSFEIDKNPETALNEVRNAVDGARKDLPSEISSITISKQTIQEDVLATYVARSNKLDEAELTWLVDNELKKSFLSVKGVGEVSRIGGVNREIHVDINPDILAPLGITAVDVSSRLRSVQADFSGGRGEVGSNRQTIRTLGALHSTMALRAAFQELQLLSA